MDKSISPEVRVLDHGYVKEVLGWGSDEEVVATARQSTQGAFVSWDPYPGHPKGDAGLLAHLWRFNHSSVFEFCGLTVEVQAPLRVARQWMRHRTLSTSEMSARYAPVPEADYLPAPERLLRDPGNNRQAGPVKGAEILTEEGASRWLTRLGEAYRTCQEVYEEGLRGGVPKELAALALPSGRYTRWRSSGNLLNWFRLLSKRLPGDAQEETRLYAGAVGGLLQARFPRCWALFAEGGFKV